MNNVTFPEADLSSKLLRVLSIGSYSYDFTNGKGAAKQLKEAFLKQHPKMRETPEQFARISFAEKNGFWPERKTHLPRWQQWLRPPGQPLNLRGRLP